MSIIIERILRPYGYAKEYRFHPVRRWRFDYAIPEYKIAIEIEGGVFSRGRHTRGVGFVNDCEKYNTATAMGWRVFRYPAHLINQDMIKLHIESLIDA